MDKYAKKMTVVRVEGVNIPICSECLKGNHDHFGGGHDCKYTSQNNKVQCGCNLEWEELQEAIRNR